MVTLLTIEPISDRHGTLIVAAFNMLFIDRGGKEDGFGNGWLEERGDGDGNGDGFGNGNGWGYGTGEGGGYGYGWGYGTGGGGYGKCPEEWRVQ